MHFSEKSPQIYDAVSVSAKNSAGQDVVIEVIQQLEDGYVRGIAMNSTDGLKRGDEVMDTGAPIEVPVGPEVLGRVFNVLGDPIDGMEPVKTTEKRPIHRKAPEFTSLATKAETLATGIKVIDLLAPVLK